MALKSSIHRLAYVSPLQPVLEGNRRCSRLRSGLALAAALLALCLLPVPAAAVEGPNVVLVVVDDMHYGDPGVYGGAVVTRAIDRIAREGMRFTSYYANAPVCSPTRAALLTGRYPQEFGFVDSMGYASYRGIPARIPTLADLFADEGYATAQIGKWHVGYRKPEFLAVNRGFEVSVRRKRDTTEPYTRFDLLVNEEPAKHPKGDFLTDVLVDHAVKFIKHHQREPFFLNLWLHAAHYPVQIPEDFDNSETGYDLNTPTGRFAALLTHTDRQVRRISRELDTLGLENTLLIVTSDNGGARRNHTTKGQTLRGFKHDLYEGGIRVPLVIRWPGKVTAGSVSDRVAISHDFFPTFVDLLDKSGFNLPGESFLAALLGESEPKPERSLFWEVSPRNPEAPWGNDYAVRRGRWKLVSQEGTTSIFDILTDPGETTNLTAERKNLLDDLQQEYLVWRRDTGRIDYEFAAQNPEKIQPQTLLDFHDGSFTFETTVKPETINQASVIAKKKESWRLMQLDGRLKLVLFNEAGARTVMRSRGKLAPGRESRVAFAVSPMNDSLFSKVSLVLDGEIVRGLAPPVRPSEAGVFLGGDDIERRGEFRGEVKAPYLSALGCRTCDASENDLGFDEGQP